MHPTNHSALLFATLIGVAACDNSVPTGTPTPPAPAIPAPEFRIVPASLGTPLTRLTGAQRRQFDAGRAVFQTVFTPETGLGPLFNAASCASCHE